MAAVLPASFNLQHAAPTTLVVTNKWQCLARSAIHTTPPKHLTLARPPAKHFTVALIAWSRLIISNRINSP
jgi:hypothetical protein